MTIYDAITFDIRVRLRLVGHPQPAKESGADHCCQSGACCHVSPPPLEPEDVERLASNLGTTVANFVDDYCCYGDPLQEEPFILLARHEQDTGVVIDDESAWSDEPCVMFDKSAWRCSVHDVKPRACAEYGCWRNGAQAIITREWTDAEKETVR